MCGCIHPSRIASRANKVPGVVMGSGNVLHGPWPHARAPAKARRAATSAKISSVMSDRPREAANTTKARHFSPGMPLGRLFQPLTVEGASSSASATAIVSPAATMSESQVHEDLRLMEPTIVRTVRTCQVIAICEATIRRNHGEISPMDSDHDVARRLIAIREHFGLNQIAFAKSLHLAKNTLNGYEKGSRQLTLETAKRIRDRYGISLDWLLFGDIGQPSHELVVKFGPAPRLSTDGQPAEPAAHRKKA